MVKLGWERSYRSMGENLGLTGNGVAFMGARVSG